ncbi:M24 family metallopeptidase [Pseudactinotalea sp.]|uniref:M24 family metallopeptidase n=1 Tax=Pseudactinotalea sp. TaxID=1926260 RepID=UPI003B3B420F
MHKGNQDVFYRMVEAAGRDRLAGIVAMSPENVAYALGFPVPSQEPLRWRHAAVAVAADGRVAVLCVDMEETTVRSQIPGADVYVWQEFAFNAVEVFATMLRDLGMDRGQVGIELEYLPAQDFLKLRNELPSAELIPADRTLNRLRQIKTPREIELIRELSRKTDRAIAHAFASVAPGDTELQLAGAAVTSLYEQGVERERGMVTASGDRSHFPNVRATDRRLGDGDLIRLELFGVSRGYHSGICRSGVVGTPSDEAKRVWDVLVDCRRRVLEVLTPGVKAQEVYSAYIERFSVLGYAPISFVGHGIGVFLHEDPYLGADDETVIEEGMVFGVEPLLYLPGQFGLQIKDTVYVGPNGAEVLSDVMDAEELVSVR